MKTPKVHRALWIIIPSFGLIYALISLVNHYLFRTYALDLGLYTNAIFDYAHFRLADSEMFKTFHEYLLGDHFDLYLIIFSPLVYIFGTYTLLVVQIAAILAGGLGIYKYFGLQEEQNQFIRLFATICFLVFFGIFSAVAFDYHSNVVAAMLVPWFFYFFKRKLYPASILILISIVIAKENMALWTLFICLGLMIEYRKDRKSLIYLTAFSMFSLVYFLAIVDVIMPMITVSGKYNGFAYTSLGQTPFEAVKEIILHPVESLKILFTNHVNSPYGDYIKLELHILVLLSGLYFLVLKPHYLIMLIPVYFQKMFHDQVGMWGINGQYSIEFAPILAIGIFTAISEFKNRKMERFLSMIAFSGILLSTIRVMDRTVAYTHKTKIRFYQEVHYERNYDVRAVYRQIRQIPDDARVTALSPFVPHLALRDHIYQFPIIKDAEYIVYSEKEEKYPLSEATFAELVQKLVNSGEWTEIYNNDGFVVLKKSEMIRNH